MCPSSGRGRGDGVVVANATGLGARTLGGVAGGALAPALGQTVLVRNESSPMMLATSGTDDGPTELCYILGGTYDLGNWQAEPDSAIAERIMRRAVEARPEMARGRGIEGLSVVSHAAGLRPTREGGVRLDSEPLGDDEDAWLVHNYGHAGWGYQGSYGCAERVVQLVQQISEMRMAS